MVREDRGEVWGERGRAGEAGEGHASLIGVWVVIRCHQQYQSYNVLYYLAGAYTFARQNDAANERQVFDMVYARNNPHLTAVIGALQTGVVWCMYMH